MVKSMKILKKGSESINRRRTDNKMVKSMKIPKKGYRIHKSKKDRQHIGQKFEDTKGVIRIRNHIKSTDNIMATRKIKQHEAHYISNVLLKCQ